MLDSLSHEPSSASKAAIIHKALFTIEGIRSSLKSGAAYFVLSLKAAVEFAICDRLEGIWQARLRRPSRKRSKANRGSAGQAVFGGACCWFIFLFVGGVL